MPSAELIHSAGLLLEAGHRPAAAGCLHAALRLDPACVEAHNLLEEHRLNGALGPAFGIDGQIHPDDEIFRFFATHPSSTNPVRDYLADGWRTLAELFRLFEHLDRKLCNTVSFLEFASGFGRFTRHLARALPAGALHVSDIVPGSVDFLREHLGVEGFYSSADPDSLRIPHRYETVFVLSLFSHLPDGLWQRWLARLYQTLLPGGQLIISTHGEHYARTAGIALPEDGYHFINASESITLDASVYGNTFTAPVYVRRAIGTLGEVAHIEHLPAHFWSSQDAWVLFKP